jgi:hypothetical protein
VGENDNNGEEQPQKVEVIQADFRDVLTGEPSAAGASINDSDRGSAALARLIFSI